MRKSGGSWSTVKNPTTAPAAAAAEDDEDDDNDVAAAAAPDGKEEDEEEDAPISAFAFPAATAPPVSPACNFPLPYT